MEIIFVVSIFCIFFAYCGYPFSLYLVGFVRNKKVGKAPLLPRLTLIVTVHNEEKRIREKLDNTVALDYPREKLQILIASDGSTDRTNEIVRDYREREIELIEISERKGKENAQKEAVRRAHGEIVVFTDAATMLDPGGLKEIVSNFADPSVGCVSSEDRLVGKDGKPCGEGFYVRYEMWLRRLESRVNSLVGLSGSFFAARKEVCQDFSEEMQSDFRTLLTSIKLGFRGVSDPYAIGRYEDIADERSEFERKVRTVLRGLTVFFRNLEFLNLAKYGFFSYQYLCHKLLRWLVPIFLFAAFVSNVILGAKSFPYLILFLGQMLFYFLAFWGRKRGNFSQRMLIKIPSYFFTVNAGTFVAWWRYLRGDRVVMWTPSQRKL